MRPTKMQSLIKLHEAVRVKFELDYNGLHGKPHWERVAYNGAKLAQINGADPEVVRLFAYLHDSCRVYEDDDAIHGTKAAHWACKLRRDGIFKLNDSQMKSLYFAIGAHSDGLTEANVTVQTCWDADRLDLGRVGIRPAPVLLCTPAARDPEMIRISTINSRKG